MTQESPEVLALARKSAASVRPNTHNSALILEGQRDGTDVVQSAIAAIQAVSERVAWQPMSAVPKHGKRIYALARSGRAEIIYANPELDRSLFLGWWPLPDRTPPAHLKEPGQ